MAVNWHRWVTSWRASHSRNSRGSKPCWRSRATTFGTHEVDQVLLVDGVLGQQQVVLAEHPGRQPAQHDPHLGPGGRPARRWPAGPRSGSARRSTPTGGSGRAGRDGDRAGAGSWPRWRAPNRSGRSPGPGRARRPSAARWRRPPAPRPGPSAPRTRPAAGRGGRGRASGPGRPPRPATFSAVSQPTAPCPRARRPGRAGGIGEGHRDQCRDAGPLPGFRGGRVSRRPWRSPRAGPGPRARAGVGHMVLAAVRQHLAQLLLESVGADAGPAQVEVPGDLDPPLLGQLAVEVEVEPLDRLVTADEARRRLRCVCTRARYAVSICSHRQSPHYLASSDAPTRPRDLPTSTNAFCRAFLPRWILLMTVPMGTSVISAISL